MHCDNGFELLISIVFAMSIQPGGIGPKAQDLVIPFRLVEGETIPDFHLRALTIISELELKRDQIGHTHILTVKYIMGLSNLKHPQLYMPFYDL